MASIKMGLVVTDIRGKLGGHVFQKGNQSRVLKTNTKPSRQNSVAVLRAQNRINTVVSAYTNLSYALKERYQQIAQGFTIKNKFGDTIQRTGRQFFLMTNNNVIKAALSFPALISPVDSNVIRGTLVSAVIDLSDLSVTLSGNPEIVGQREQIYGLKISNNGLAVNVDSFIYLVATVTLNETSYAVYDKLIEKYGVVSANDNIYIGHKSTNTSGFATEIQYVKCTFV